MRTDEEYRRWGVEAAQQFERARRHATIEGLVGRLTGRTTELVPFDDVQRLLGLHTPRDRGLHDIPITKIVGSVGKGHAFTRSLWPKHARQKERWKRVYTLVRGVQGLPPIDVYKVGDVYFVIDGHHRLSVARQLDVSRIEAHVIEFVSPIPLSVDNVDALVAPARRRSGRDVPQAGGLAYNT